MDFGIWGPPGQNTDNVASQQQSQQQASTGNGTNTNNGNTGSGVGARGNEGDGVVLMHHMEHPGVVCDICDTTVCGFRYKCMQCDDFDLCHFCERKGHHAGHIMMRISFPEQATEAINKYIRNGRHSPSSHHPAPWCRNFPTMFPPPAGGPGRHHHSSRSHGRRRDSSPENNSDGPTTGGNGCPYDMSKKGWKKFSKCMKKSAHHQRRAAEAYKSFATNGGAAPAGSESTTPRQGTTHQMDFSAAASQIQDFLNAWGVPIDVVELYDDFGNRGQPPQSANVPPGTPNEDTINPTRREGESTTAAEPASTIASQSALSDQLFQLNIGNNDAGASANTSELSKPAAVGLEATAPSMDVDGETGWTLIDNVAETLVPNKESVVGEAEIVSKTPDTVAPSASTSDSQPSAVVSNTAAPISFMLTPTRVDSPLPASTAFNNPTAATAIPMNNAIPVSVASNGSLPTSMLSMDSSLMLAHPIRNPTNTAPTVPAGHPSMPIYPVLNAMNNPQFHQMMQGVTNAVGSAIRSIPLPMGADAFPRMQQPGPPSVARTQEAGNSIPDMDAQSLTTLNQLLSMGFSNHDGWLARLVVAKKGDLEAVLNALFPGGSS